MTGKIQDIPLTPMEEINISEWWATEGMVPP